MAYGLSVQFLLFLFASRTSANICSTQGLNKSFTRLCSFLKLHLNPCLAQIVYMNFLDDVAAGVNTFDEMISALRIFFDLLRESDEELSSHNWEFGTTIIDYLSGSIIPKSVLPENAKTSGTIYDARHSETSEMPNWLCASFSVL